MRGQDIKEKSGKGTYEHTEKSRKVHLSNWMADVLLEKRISSLNKEERDVISYITIDQRIVTAKFRNKLSRSAKIAQNHQGMLQRLENKRSRHGSRPAMSKYMWQREAETSMKKEENKDIEGGDEVFTAENISKSKRDQNDKNIHSGKEELATIAQDELANTPERSHIESSTVRNTKPHDKEHGCVLNKNLTTLKKKKNPDALSNVDDADNTLADNTYSKSDDSFQFVTDATGVKTSVHASNSTSGRPITEHKSSRFDHCNKKSKAKSNSCHNEGVQSWSGTVEQNRNKLHSVLFQRHKLWSERTEMASHNVDRVKSAPVKAWRNMNEIQKVLISNSGQRNKEHARRSISRRRFFDTFDFKQFEIFRDGETKSESRRVTMFIETLEPLRLIPWTPTR